MPPFHQRGRHLPRNPVSDALRATRSAFIGVAALSCVTNLLMLTGPLFMMQIYDRVLASRSVPTLVVLSILVIGIYLLLGILEVIRSRILIRIGSSIDSTLSDAAVHTELRLPLKLSRMQAAPKPVRDLDTLRGFLSGPGPVAICDLPWLPIYLALIFLFHVYLGWLALAGAVVLAILTVCSEYILRKPSQHIAQLGVVRADMIEAGRRNTESLHAMGMAQAYTRQWQGLNDDFLHEHSRTADITSGFSATTKIFRLALQSAVLALAAWLAIHQEMSPGAMIAASILSSRALAPVEQAIAHWRVFLAARQARSRLHDVIGRLETAPVPMRLPSPERDLTVDGVCVAAPGTSQILVRDINLTLKAGDGLGIIGPSGSGKSTLARALVGVWPTLRGTIRLDGAELIQWTPENLGSSIGYLPQGVELFDGTIAENICRFIPETNPADIIAAAQAANIHHFILSLQQGYDTRIGMNGSVLSAGQRQRLGLARALFGKPFLVVLDEPNANLDAEGEAALTQAVLDARQTGAIVVIIAHRPNALAAVDHVLVMNSGAQAAFGPRDDILRKTTLRTVAESA
jgi:ATP-binding cassette subfamily C protein PrsD